MIFEWDENKNKLNQRKHGISFEEAVRVFADPNLKIVLDPEESEYVGMRWVWSVKCCL
ncbi:BrnT family toxin [Treponema vincentii]|uniref:BrnT family toxin n=1 Tax=Treponema vincentii TaxID=69710 RepID=UPI003D93757C